MSKRYAALFAVLVFLASFATTLALLALAPRTQAPHWAACAPTLDTPRLQDGDVARDGNGVLWKCDDGNLVPYLASTPV
jgi:hypothetical protein